MTERELLELLKESAKNRSNEISDILSRISHSETTNVLVKSHKKALEEIMAINEKLKTLI